MAEVYPDINCIKCKKHTKNIDATQEKVKFNIYNKDDKYLRPKNRRVDGERFRDAIKAKCAECNSKKNLLVKMKKCEPIIESKDEVKDDVLAPDGLDLDGLSIAK
jgi:hypothetical protein